MASSKCLSNEQFSIECQLCHVNPNIKWKCLQCDLFMCNTCRGKVHPKIKTSGDHKVIDVNDISLHDEGSIPSIDFLTIKCVKHANQNCCLFCKDCDALICLDCVTQTHSKHEKVKIREEYEKRQEEMNDKLQILKKNREELINMKDGLKEKLQGERENHHKTKKDILDQQTALKTDVDQFTAKLLEDLDLTMESIEQSVAEDENKADKLIKEIEENSAKANKVVKASDVNIFFEESGIIKKSFKENVPVINHVYDTVPKFVPGKITPAHIGCLIKCSKNETGLSSITLKKVKQFATKMPTIELICLTLDDSIWISNHESSLLQNVKIEGNHLKIIKTLKSKVYSIGTTSNGDILLSVNQSTLQQLDKTTGKLLDIKYMVDPFNTGPIHVTNDDQVIVGAFNNEEAVIIVMANNGRHLVTYQYDQNRKPLFTFPIRITTVSKGNIWVIDIEPQEKTGRVLVLLPTGVIEHIYTGHAHINRKESPFHPTSIVATPLDNVVVADPQNGLHILNKMAQLTKFIDTNEIGIELPYSLALTKSGKLFLGSTRKKKGNSEHAKLYELELTGY